MVFLNPLQPQCVLYWNKENKVLLSLNGFKGTSLLHPYIIWKTRLIWFKFCHDFIGEWCLPLYVLSIDVQFYPTLYYSRLCTSSWPKSVQYHVATAAVVAQMTTNGRKCCSTDTAIEAGENLIVMLIRNGDQMRFMILLRGDETHSNG